MANERTTRDTLRRLLASQEQLKHGIIVEALDTIAEIEPDFINVPSTDPSSFPGQSVSEPYAVALDTLHEDPINLQSFHQPDPHPSTPQTESSTAFSYPYRSVDEAATAFVAAQPDTYVPEDHTDTLYTGDQTSSYDLQPTSLEDLFSEASYAEERYDNTQETADPDPKAERRHRANRKLQTFGAALVGLSFLSLSAYGGTYVATRDGDTVTNVKEWLGDRDLIAKSYELPEYEQRYLSVTSNVTNLGNILGVLR